jgi:hypothetical protein
VWVASEIGKELNNFELYAALPAPEIENSEIEGTGVEAGPSKQITF